MRAGVFLVRLPVPLVEVRTRPAEDQASPLAVRLCAGCLSRTITHSVSLYTSFAMMTAVPEGSEGTARTTEAIERTFPPGDVPNATENQEAPGKVRATLVVAKLLHLAGLDQGVPEAIVIRIVDQPEPTENE
jgi:hypothetical protein